MTTRTAIPPPRKGWRWLRKGERVRATDGFQWDAKTHDPRGMKNEEGISAYGPLLCGGNRGYCGYIRRTKGGRK